jgi:DNA helicase HerA-like ATPase
VTDVQASLEEYRGMREALEAALLPLATSVDGRRFNFQVSLHGLELEPGGYVAIEGEGFTRLGQLLSLELRHQDTTAPGMPGQVRFRAGGGEGVVLQGDDRPFHDALVRRATPDEVGAWLEGARPDRAQLDVGELAFAPGVPFRLDAGGFGRHTFLCGQSGSGKTYSLGVLLERLLMETNLRVVVLDPNSDYVRLGEPRVDDTRYGDAAASVRVRGGSSGAEPIRIRFRDLSPVHQAGLLRLDPLADRAEYGELLGLVEDESIRSLEDLAESPAEDLKLRARNLGIDRFGIWPGPEGESLLDELVSRAGPRCLVVDLGSLGTRDEQTLTAGAVLERLWRERGRREPVAIVIDEAQNVCPAEPADPLTALATEDAIRIAGEGRKFGLYLIVVTQRPQKIHENVLSQCDNLVLMRMNSVADLAHVAGAFSFVPAGLVDRAMAFRQGEALVAGKIASHPALVRFGSRISYEGGADVAGWA